MHKGVILLVKASNRQEATDKAETFLNKHEGKVWDWYQIGGRWSGTLLAKDPQDDPENKGKWPTEFRPDDSNVVPLSDVTSVVTEWAKDWEQGRLKEVSEGEARFKDNPDMLKYYERKRKSITGDKFSFESNVYDINKRTNKPPANPDGYWAVMVDMHN